MASLLWVSFITFIKKRPLSPALEKINLETQLSPQALKLLYLRARNDLSDFCLQVQGHIDESHNAGLEVHNVFTENPDKLDEVSRSMFGEEVCSEDMKNYKTMLEKRLQILEDGADHQSQEVWKIVLRSLQQAGTPAHECQAMREAFEQRFKGIDTTQKLDLL
mmetsp:Transcript_31406/g.48025  ORF Transcript_31406/g.48025 Transcript_31406/m.48025 type:complete len:163 (-) Transcript_31406:225-713(-)